jgi:hypothetical protein
MDEDVCASMPEGSDKDLGICEDQLAVLGVNCIKRRVVSSNSFDDFARDDRLTIPNMLFDEEKPVLGVLRAPKGSIEGGICKLLGRSRGGDAAFVRVYKPFDPTSSERVTRYLVLRSSNGIFLSVNCIFVVISALETRCRSQLTFSPSYVPPESGRKLSKDDLRADICVSVWSIDLYSHLGEGVGIAAGNRALNEDLRDALYGEADLEIRIEEQDFMRRRAD